METQEKPMNEKESLQLIEEMILAAKKSVTENGFYFLLWGWLVIIASLTDYFLMRMEINKHGLVWAVIMITGGIISGIYGYRDGKNKTVKTHIDTLMSYLWGAFMISLLIFLYFSLSKMQSPCPPLLVLCGIGTFVSGGALKFKPLIIGGVLFWIFSVITFLIDIQYHLPIYALAIFIGYIIPGYVLKANFQKKK